ncbi:MAG TPA: RNA-binding S4 domain-containing protein [Candidatus Pelethocola excrementipullorum]|nr:RNA-binding S4 domain-containing protein [Candidatus Pelethocola excrementipullorum]
METIKIKDEFIKLGQAMKLAGLADEGVDAKFQIQEGNVKVNGEVDTRRGKKLYVGDVFSFGGTDVKVERVENS